MIDVYFCLIFPSVHGSNPQLQEQQSSQTGHLWTRRRHKSWKITSTFWTFIICVHWLRKCFPGCVEIFIYSFEPVLQSFFDKNRLLHRKWAVQVFIHESQNFRSARVSIANEWVSKVLQRVNKIRTKHFLWSNLSVIY